MALLFFFTVVLYFSVLTTHIYSISIDTYNKTEGMLKKGRVLKHIADDQIPHCSNTIEFRAYFNNNKLDMLWNSL